MHNIKMSWVNHLHIILEPYNLNLNWAIIDNLSCMIQYKFKLINELLILINHLRHHYHHHKYHSLWPAWSRRPPPPPGSGWWTWRGQPAPATRRSHCTATCTGHQWSPHWIWSLRVQSHQTQWWSEWWRWSRILQWSSNSPRQKIIQHLSIIIIN